MITYGLIGFPLTHSWSVKYFSEKFRDENIYGKKYCLFPVKSIDEFPALIDQNIDLAGLNVTIPYKGKVIQFLDEIDDTAKEIGAVNTIQIFRKNGKVILKGFNTDAEAFRVSANFTGHSKALVLGTGGAAKAVRHALNGLGIQSLFVSRNAKYPGTIGYSELSPGLIYEYTLIINATPLGMYPEIDSFPPIPYQYLSNRHFLYDLVYNPELTRFLQNGKGKKAKIQNGLKMLQIQADKSYEIWNSPKEI